MTAYASYDGVPAVANSRKIVTSFSALLLMLIHSTDLLTDIVSM